MHMHSLWETASKKYKVLSKVKLNSSNNKILKIYIYVEILLKGVLEVEGRRV